MDRYQDWLAAVTPCRVLYAVSLRQPGQVLGGKYRLIRELGKGGMGSVWHAQHLALNAPVALKFIESEKLESAGLQRFLAEARVAATLRSPHVVQILDYGVDEGMPHIAMELLEGESLAARLARVGRLRPHEAARVIQQVVRAVGRAHDAGIVHRDLKPENVFIVANDDEELIKVLDFGIAKANRAVLGESAAAATRTGELLGTPYYMSPEQLDGLPDVDHRTDIWALGVLAFKCLTGQLPFTGDSVGRLVLSICSRPLPVPSAVAAVPTGFDVWFARACARDPAARFESIRQAAQEFALVCGEDVGHAASVPSPRRGTLAPAAPTNPRAEPFATTTGQATNAETNSRAVPPRRRVWVLIAAAVVAAAVFASVRQRGGASGQSSATVATTSVERTAGSTPTEAPAAPPSAKPAPPDAPAAAPAKAAGKPAAAAMRENAGERRAPRGTRTPKTRKSEPSPRRVPALPSKDLDLGI